MPRSKVVRFDLRAQIISSNDSDSDDSTDSSSSSYSSSASSNTSHNTSVASLINSPPLSPNAISLQFGDSDDSLHSPAINSPNSSANSSNAVDNSDNDTSGSDNSLRSLTRRRFGRNRISASENSDSDNDNAPSSAANSDASSNSSDRLYRRSSSSDRSNQSVGAAGGSFGFSPQRSSFGGGGGGGSSSGRGNNSSLSENSLFSDNDDDNDELRSRRQLFDALALVEPAEEDQEQEREPPASPIVSPASSIVRPSIRPLQFGHIRGRAPRRPPRPNSFITLPTPRSTGGLVSLFSPSASSSPHQTLRFFRRPVPQPQEEDPEELVVTENEDEEWRGWNPSIARIFEEQMSRVQGAAGQGQGQGASCSSAGAPRVNSAPVGPSMISYECSVCLENLDQPASIDLDNNGGDGQSQGGIEGVELFEIIQAVGRRGGGRGRGLGISVRNVASAPAAAGRQRAADNPVNLTDVVATHCGHLYHQVCLEKWFTEQGRRTCPSCRKSVPKSKCIRLYPNISQDPGGRGGGNQHNENAAPVVVVPSASGSSSANPSSGTSSGMSTATEGLGGGGGQPLCIAAGGGGDGGGNGNAGEACRRADCQDLKVIHNTLINDYNDLQERYNDLRENDQLKEATIRSLEDDNAQKGNEIDRLKRQIAESPGRSAASSSGSAPKRRRK